MPRCATIESSPRSALAPAASQHGVYRARKPKESPLWQIVERHFEEFLQVCDERFAPTYGPLRSGVRHALEAFQKCGILDWGSALSLSKGSRASAVLSADTSTFWRSPASAGAARLSSRRSLCPSCHKKRQIEFGEFVAEQILESVPHRHVVLSLPRRLRPYFRRPRRRLAKLARAAYETLKDLLQIAADTRRAMPGAVACIQSYGSLLDWHPHIHLLISWGLFTRDGTFIPVDATPDTEILEKLFRHKVLRLLQDEEAIDEQAVANRSAELATKPVGLAPHRLRRPREPGHSQ